MTAGSYQRSCHDCGSVARDTPFPGTRKPHGRADRCCDCAAEFARLVERVAEPALRRRTPGQTRAAYRAAYRHRAAQPQMDLGDLLVAPP